MNKLHSRAKPKFSATTLFCTDEHRIPKTQRYFKIPHGYWYPSCLGCLSVVSELYLDTSQILAKAS